MEGLHINGYNVLHLISLNKYVVTLIINQGNSCLTYFMIVSLFLAVLAVVLQELSARIIPLLEKILLLVRYFSCNSMKKFVVSSIIRAISKCYHLSATCNSVYRVYRPNSFSLFVLFHLFWAVGNAIYRWNSSINSCAFYTIGCLF